MSSLYAKYVKEREGNEVIETPWGFIEYYISLPFLKIEAIYVLPDFRKSHLGSKLADMVASIGRKAGATHMMAQVQRNTLNWQESLAAVKGYGFKVQSDRNNTIMLIKSLRGGSNGKSS